jgi:uncharacterized YigZ family protein
MLTIAEPGLSEQTINKSRFLAWVAYCDSEQQVSQFLRAVAAQHASAHHLAYAYRVKTTDGIIPRFSDAGEPSGTAGKPILKMLEGRDLMNTCVAVIRYYGGINLGTGGLARAYSDTATLALQLAKTIPYTEMQALTLTVHYNQVDAVIHAVKQVNGAVLDKVFSESVQIKVKVPTSEVQQLMNRF